MYLRVLTAVLHYLNCLALCWPTQTQFVPSFSHILLAHLRLLHLSIFPLGWLKASKRLNIWHQALSLSIYPKSFQSKRYLWKAVVLPGTCWWCSLTNAAKTPLFQLSSFFCWSADTLTQFIKPSCSSLVDSKSVLDNNDVMSMWAPPLYCLSNFFSAVSSLLLMRSLPKPVALHFPNEIPEVQEYDKHLNIISLPSKARAPHFNDSLEFNK